MQHNGMKGYMNAKHLKAYRTQLLRHCAERVRLVLNHASNAQEEHHALTAP
jgi:hypothetical protein